jgi:hypothetical protein
MAQGVLSNDAENVSIKFTAALLAPIIGGKLD